jgi:negative regulator of sigma E activity
MAASSADSAISSAPERENCSEVRLLLSALVDNEATPEEAVRAKAHTATCDNCASHFAFLRLTGRVLSQTPEVLPSASLSARIAAATYERPTLAQRVAGWLRPAPVRVGLGAAVAAGLTMVLIVPRIGEIDTANIGTSGKSGTIASKERSANDAGDKSAKTIAQKSASKTAKNVILPETKPKTTELVKPLPVAKQSVVKSLMASVPEPALPAVKPAPINVASNASRRSVGALAGIGSTLANPNDLILHAQHPRTDSPIDRNKPRSSPKFSVKLPGMSNMTMPRSGYNRTEETSPILKPRESAAASESVATASPVNTSGIAPLLPDNGSGKLAEPQNMVAERTSSPLSAATTATAPIVSSGSGNLQFRTGSRKNSGVESFSFNSSNSTRRPALGMSDSGTGLGSSPMVKAGIVDAPVTGLNR